MTTRHTFVQKLKIHFAPNIKVDGIKGFIFIYLFHGASRKRGKIRKVFTLARLWCARAQKKPIWTLSPRKGKTEIRRINKQKPHRRVMSNKTRGSVKILN